MKRKEQVHTSCWRIDNCKHSTQGKRNVDRYRGGFAHLKFFPSRWRGRFIEGGRGEGVGNGDLVQLPMNYSCMHTRSSVLHLMHGMQPCQIETERDKSHFQCTYSTITGNSQTLLKIRRYFINFLRIENFPSNGSKY